MGDSGSLLRVNPNPINTDYVPQVWQALSPEQALGQFDEKPIIPQQLEDNPDVLLVLLLVAREDENVINVNQSKCAQDGLEYHVHHALEFARGICQAKAHDLILEHAKRCLESRFLLIGF
jgi:hypothetical protein